MSEDQVIPPVFSETTDEEIQAEVEATQEAQDVEQALADLSYHEGFLQLRKVLETRLADYRSGKQLAISSTDDFSVIGQKYLVSSLVANELESILGVVDAATESRRRT